MIHISLNYFAAEGERLVLSCDSERRDMESHEGGVWSIGLEKEKVGEFRFEVWSGEVCVRKEWGVHHAVDGGGKDVVVEARWKDRPSDAPFHSKLFTDVIFQRKVRRKVASGGNVTLCVSCAQVRPDEALAITGSSQLLGNWTKMTLLSDEDFPLWRISASVAGVPFEYKFVIVDKKTHEPKAWEVGDNRHMALYPGKGSRYVLELSSPEFDRRPWRGAGVAVPVFALRSDDSFGVGEFNDIKRLADWAAATGQNLIQLLPINDTTMTGTWQDSYPYNANTTFALHPQFIHLPDAGVRQTKAYKELKDKLNALPQIDYERVNEEKRKFLLEAYERQAKSLEGDKGYKRFVSDNAGWLLPYAVYCCLRDKYGTAEFEKWGKEAKFSEAKVSKFAKEHEEKVGFYFFEQFVLDRQLREAVAYAHSKGVGLKGDLPIGVSRTSADAWQHPDLFHLDSQAGAPPDAFSVNGQNWGFPTYDWEAMSKDGYAWWKARLGKMSDYFDAFRIDHILGFFRIWEIPYSAVHGLLGHFNPALPYSAEDLAEVGFDMDGGRYTRPLMASWVIDRVFGSMAPSFMEKYVKDEALDSSVDTQRKVLEKVEDKKMQEALMNYLDDVLFLEDPRRPGFYHPRISAQYTLQYEALSPEMKDAFNKLYDDFFYHRHNDFWAEAAMEKLPSLLDSTGMLACGEDLGMIPDCVPSVMDALGVLSLEIQRMPKSPTMEFGEPSRYPYRCVCATGTHDTSGIRAWWEEDRAATQRFYNSALGCDGEAPFYCEPWVCEKIVRQHLASPAMLCVLPLQDWLSMDGKLRYQGNPSDERINVPAIPRYYWRYRMHLSLRDLMDATEFDSHLSALVRDSGRG